MAYVVKRANGYAAYYRDANKKRRSVGVFPTKREAILAGEKAEVGILPEEYVNQRTLLDYVEVWLANETKVMPTTLISYESDMRRYVLPTLGEYQVAQITRDDVQYLVDSLLRQGVNPHVVNRCKAALGSCLRNLVPKILTTNPTHGIKVKTPPKKNFNFLEFEEAQRIVEALPTEGSKLFARFLAATGCRFGEASEIRRKDLNFKTGEVEVCRRSIDIGAKRNNGSRFRVVHGTKAGLDRARTIVMPESFMNELRAWCDSKGIDQEDLVFRVDLVRGPKAPRTLRKKRGGPFVEGNRTFHHGTTYAYSTGGCRCEDCLDAVRAYRRRRSPTSSATNDSGHMGNDVWTGLWKRAVKDANIGWSPRVYDLRHAFATQLLVAGVDIFEVKTLMGHASLETTLYYLHRVNAQKSKTRAVIESIIP